MTTFQPAEDADGIRREIRQIEEDLVQLRRKAADLHQVIGDRSYGPTDSNEVGTMIENAEEEDSLIETLEARREALLGRLGED